MTDGLGSSEIPERNDDIIRMEGNEKKLRQMYPYNASLLNPFQLKQTLTTVQLLKALIMTLILPIRLLLMLLVLGIAWIIAIITLAGLPKDEAEGLEPLSGWRRRWAKPLLSKMSRFVFFLGGWMWVTFKGERATKREAPILLVMPHSSFLDTALVPMLDCPGLVVRDFTAKAPFFGDLIRYTQPLFVNSEDPNSRHQIAEAIRKRVQSDKDFEQLMLFPEGGCGNRKALIQFKLGAFSPGVAVQPVFVRYHNNLDTITWTWDGPGAWNQIWLTLTQFRIYCEIEFLPVYKPSDIEKSNPRLYANNVQNYVSSWTGCPMTHFAIEDARFVRLAKSLKLPLTAPLIKFLRLRASIGRQDMDPAEELHLLRDRNREVTHFQGDAPRMAEYIGLSRCPEAMRDFFRTVNQKEKENLDVRIYAACLCLIRQDMEARLKLKSAFQAFTSESEVEHLSTILLLWKGIPANLINNKNLSSFDKIENEEMEQDSRNFL